MRLRASSSSAHSSSWGSDDKRFRAQRSTSFAEVAGERSTSNASRAARTPSSMAAATRAPVARPRTELARERADAAAHQPREPPALLQQARDATLERLVLVALADEDRDQLLVAQRLDTAFESAFAEPWFHSLIRLDVHGEAPSEHAACRSDLTHLMADPGVFSNATSGGSGGSAGGRRRETSSCVVEFFLSVRKRLH